MSAASAATLDLPGFAPVGESTLVHEILVELSKLPETICWRQNVGVGVAPGQRVIRFGVPGMADVGCIRRGRHVEIEAKSRTGRQRPQQKRWQAAVERAGGAYLIVRSAAEAVAWVSAL